MSASGRRRFLRTTAAGAAAVAVAGLPALARAAEVQVQATLGRPRVEVGQSVYLQIEVASEAGAIGTPSFPTLEGVEVNARGSSSGFSVEMSGAGRVRRSTKTFTYVLTPRTAGEHEIEVVVEVGGRSYRPATPPTLTATGENFSPEPERAEAGDTPPAPDSEVIVWPVVDKSTAYVGEQIVYELQIWERAHGNLTVAAAPTFKDFWSEDLEPPRQRARQQPKRELIAGVPYRVHRPMRRALFPQRAGTLEIGGPEIELQEISGPFFGGSGPPRSYFGRSLAVEVEPLPAKGQPPNFRPNNVGQFRVTSELDRTSVEQGEAVRLSVRISGTGNIALVELPELPELEGLRAYEPKPETPKLVLGKEQLSGSRVYTVLLVADRAGTLEIPAIELPYFNPETEAYETAKTKAITLEVEPDPEAGGETAGAELDEGEGEGEDEAGDDELLAPPIASDTLTRVTPRERRLDDRRWWVGSLAAPAVLGLGWLAGKLRARFGPDEEVRARVEEQARRRNLLNEANAAVDSGEGFYPKLASLLQSAAVFRAGSEGVGLTRERLMKLLVDQGVPEDEVAQLGALLDASDAARFGSGSGDAAQRREHLEQARALLGRRGWRPQ